MRRLYNVGDSVVIRDDLSKYCDYSGESGFDPGVNDVMISFRGRSAKITEYGGDMTYYIDIDDGRWHWSSSMFDGLATEADFQESDAPLEMLLGRTGSTS